MGIRTKRHVCAARLLPSRLPTGANPTLTPVRNRISPMKAHKHLDHLVLVVAPGNKLKQ